MSVNDSLVLKADCEKFNNGGQRTENCSHISIVRVHVKAVGGVAQWQNVGLWPANFPCPALDLQLMGDH